VKSFAVFENEGLAINKAIIVIRIFSIRKLPLSF
jgi:hypothetical protein